MYKCIKCTSELKELPKGMIRCPNCAGKILIKQRSPITKEIQVI
ncbi:MAG: DNA-directed RNA polymerase subunit P [Candidatus Diapherotrites archaeon]|nr:DNA-directed RNA polymerase subunit P [Candidatus Diapherotrites archaeon]